MTTTSGVSTSSSVGTGNATDVSSLQGSSYSLSLAEAVSVKVQPYLTRADSIATEINTNKTKVTAYQTMQTLLQALETATSNLSSQALEGSNVFNARAAGLTSKAAVNGSTPSDASTLLSATVSTGTNTGSHTVVVNQLAAAEEDVSATQNFSSTTALGITSGSFSITEAGKTPLSITVTSTMSLNDLASSINGGTNQTGVSASVVSIDSSHSVLVITGSDPDTPLQFGDGSGILAGLGLTTTSTTSQSSTETLTSSTAALGVSGSFTINGPVSGSPSTATPVSVTITSTMSLNAIAAAINSAASTAGVTGTLATVSAGNSLTITSGTGGSALSFSGVSGNVLSSLAFSSLVPADQVTAAQPASLTIDGVSGITRTTNNITDALSGVSLDLTGADPNTIVTVTVEPDTAGATSAIQALVTAYNNWESFIQQNEATNSDGTAASSAVLFGDSTLREVSLQLDSSVTSMINNMSLADIGIALNSSNNLTVDSTTLASQLSTNFNGVLGLFQSQITTSSYTLQTRGTDYSSFAGSFALDITSNGSGITGLTFHGGASVAGLFTFSGNSITGVSGSAYDGMSFTYTGATGVSTVTVTATVGLANQLYTTSKNYGNTLNGTVENLVTSLQDEDSSMTTQYNTIIAQANSYTTFLLQQYANLTTQIQTASYTSTVLNEMFAMQTKG